MTRWPAAWHWWHSPFGLVLFYLAQLRRDRSDLFRSTGDGP